MKTGLIDGQIPSIDPKNVKMSHFSLHNRKNSVYKRRPSTILKFNRKNSVYFKVNGNSTLWENKSHIELPTSLFRYRVVQ